MTTDGDTRVGNRYSSKTIMPYGQSRDKGRNKV